MSCMPASYRGARCIDGVPAQEQGKGFYTERYVSKFSTVSKRRAVQDRSGNRLGTKLGTQGTTPAQSTLRYRQLQAAALTLPVPHPALHAGTAPHGVY